METASQRDRFVVAIHHTPQGCYARVLNLPGCIAKGASEVEAIENLRAVIPTFVTIARLIECTNARVSLEISV